MLMESPMRSTLGASGESLVGAVQADFGVGAGGIVATRRILVVLTGLGALFGQLVASGGSLISSRCFNSMNNPWDDDIDIVVAPSDCIKLQSIWQAGKATNGPEHVFYHRVGWDHRVLGNLVIHTRAYGDTERAIFKFR